METGSDLPGNVRINICSGHAAMAEQLLDGSDILSAFQKVTGICVAKRMDRSGFVDAAFQDRLLEGGLQVIANDVAVFEREKEAGTISMNPVVRPQKLERTIGKMDIAIFSTLAVTHHEDVSFTIDVACRKPYRFGNAQAAGIDDGQGHAIDRIYNQSQDGPHFTLLQNHRRFLVPCRPDYVEDNSFPFQGFFKKEFDSA